MASIKKIIKQLAFKIWEAIFPSKNQQYIFIMGHPRSGSSLLMHLLTTNKSIIGYGEYFTKYQTYSDLKKFEFDIRRKTNTLFKKVMFVANQITDAERTPNLKLLKSQSIKYIFILRKPQETISSIILLSQLKNKGVTQQEALTIYIDRLANMCEISKIIRRENYISITYDDLTNNSIKSLNDVTAFLKLCTPLTANYKIKKYTQVSGDPSIHIKKGVIFKPNSQQIKLDEDILTKGAQAYTETLKILNINT